MSGKVAAEKIKTRARELRALGERKTSEFRRAQAGRIVSALTLHEKEGVVGTPALASNYLRLTVRGKLAANEWVDVAVGEDGLSAEITEIAKLSSVPA